MKLSRALICAEPDCEEVFSLPSPRAEWISRWLCPACGSETFVPLAKWLNREEKAK